MGCLHVRFMRRIWLAVGEITFGKVLFRVVQKQLLLMSAASDEETVELMTEYVDFFCLGHYFIHSPISYLG